MKLRIISIYQEYILILIMTIMKIIKTKLEILNQATRGTFYSDNEIVVEK